MNEQRTSEQASLKTFDDIPIGGYFVWARNAHEGALMKINRREAVDEADRVYHVPRDERVLA